jgi:hypothetical protein
MTIDESKATARVRPGPPIQPGRRRKPRSRRRRLLRSVGLLFLVLLIPVAWSIGHALTAAGHDSTSARLAEWARGHHAGFIVNWAEQISYSLNPPKVGGTPPPTSPLVTGGAPTVGTTHGRDVVPAAIQPIASPALPGEGKWHILSTVHGQPAILGAYLRPDAVHTSYTAGVVWMNPHLVRWELHPGVDVPGGSHWSAPPSLPASQRSGLLAAFNSGFVLGDSHGGFYLGGRTRGRLRDGAASMVISRDGTATVGAWGHDVSMNSNVVAVRQNLKLLVDNGRPVDGLATNAGNAWGATLGNKKLVWRSGVGVDAKGNVIFVAGNRLSAVSLAELFHRAGAVRAMELDINPYWTSYILYKATSDPRHPDARNLLPDMQRSPHRYDSTSTRDFFAVYAR